MADDISIDRVELDHLHSTIGRLEGMCFQLKALCITLVCGALAFVSTKPASVQPILFCSVFVILVFWLLDARYLLGGRLLRAEYAQAFRRLGGNPTMSLARQPDHARFYLAFFSWSVSWIYAALIILVIGMLWLLQK